MVFGDGTSVQDGPSLRNDFSVESVARSLMATKKACLSWMCLFCFGGDFPGVSMGEEEAPATHLLKQANPSHEL
jgi:hypothetical protein